MKHESYFTGWRRRLRKLGFASLSQRLPDHPQVPGLGNPWWSDFFALVEAPDTFDIFHPRALIEPLDRLPRLPKTAQALIQASRFAISYGLFSLGGTMRLVGRDILLECLIDGRLIPGSSLYVATMAGLVEVGRWDEFIAAMMKLPADSGQYRKAMGTLLTTVAPVPLQKNYPLLATSLPRDPLFVEYVAGKRIAVVGPAASTAGQGPCIDSYDLVARFNYKEERVGLDPLHKGESCDLIYFNRAQTDYLVTAGDLSCFPRAPLWVITRRQKHADALRRALQAEAASSGAVPWRHRYRSTPVYEVPLFRGLFTAVPNAILDLLHCGAASVDVFHADFMLSPERSPQYSPFMTDLTEAVRITVRSFANAHDPITQIAMMKTARHSGRIDGDEPFCGALRLGDQEYMDALQRIYGNAILRLRAA